MNSKVCILSLLCIKATVKLHAIHCRPSYLEEDEEGVPPANAKNSFFRVITNLRMCLRLFLFQPEYIQEQGQKQGQKWRTRGVPSIGACSIIILQDSLVVQYFPWSIINNIWIHL
jgi:hypothetical protein